MGAVLAALKTFSGRDKHVVPLMENKIPIFWNKSGLLRKGAFSPSWTSVAKESIPVLTQKLLVLYTAIVKHYYFL